MQDKREQFEEMVKNTPYFGYPEGDSGDALERDEEDGGYIDACVHAAWLGFNWRDTL